MKISLYVIVDNLFKFLLIFIFNIIWCLYFINTPIVSMLVALAVSLVMIITLYFINKKKYGKKQITLKKQQHMEDVKNTFIFMSASEMIVFFKGLIKTKHECKIENNYILVQTPALPILVCPIFKHSSLTIDDVLKIYKSVKHKNLKRLVILTNKFDAEVLVACKNFKFETIVYDYKKTYLNLLQAYSFYPEIKIKKEQKAKRSLSKFIAIAIDKKRTKGYLLSAIFLIFSSFFVIYKAYYLIFASILITLAFFSYFKPQLKPSPNINILN